MKPFEYVLAGLLAIIAIPAVLFSYNNWMEKTGQGGYGAQIAVTGSPSHT
jgi:hypothetical protein